MISSYLPYTKFDNIPKFICVMDDCVRSDSGPHDIIDIKSNISDMLKKITKFGPQVASLGPK